ncbi:MAG: ABC transporter permease [Rhodospirillaceae bacterium]|jgi:peptide/nickel transport system permease protein|nr:ABC transporter permease [Rhodospirillaceae bacterium]MBT3928767.1 ABC transporter permease [Rhodospirillaceae bacterium]MBT5039290.1 ABC transporter permease [Rhodospirillaceae bacterium]MBT6828189.1 ABC transporter permease [Rhodospirillaceae bacterium]MBT7292104.1 ABC transporter permease [Rhodospirillaceae bacterium]
MPAQAILVAAPGAVLREIGRWSITLKIGSLMLLVIVLAGIFAPVVAPFDPYFQDYDKVLLPPNGTHLFGTDQLGRDLFSRVIYGIRIDLVVGFIITFVPMIYGVAIGALAGYYGGVLDGVLMRLLDTAIAFPFLVLIIVVIAILGPGVHSIYIAVFLVAWTMYARLARAEMLVERSKDYMLAAKTLGYPTSRIIFRHALPNIIGSSVVFSMADFVLNILLLSGLSFLGLGIQPPEPEWGAMVAEGRDFIFENWWICTLPGLAIVVAGTSLSLIGDGLARRLGQRHQAIL